MLRATTTVPSSAKTATRGSAGWYDRDHRNGSWRWKPPPSHVWKFVKNSTPALSESVGLHAVGQSYARR